MKRLCGIITALGACGGDDPKHVECDPLCHGDVCEPCVESECVTCCEVNEERDDEVIGPRVAVPE